MSSSRTESVARTVRGTVPLLAAAEALERLADVRVERVAERRSPARLRLSGALGRGRPEPVEELAGAHRVDAAALGDVAKHRVVGDDGARARRLGGGAVAQSLRRTAVG